MTILSVVQAAAPKCGFTRPSALLSDSSATSLNIQQTLTEVARQIRDEFDWNMYKALGTFTGDGVSLAFNPPANYARMLKDASLWSSGTPFTPLTHVINSDDWLGMITQAFTPLIGAWTILGEQFQVRIGGNTSALAAGSTLQFYYITNLQFQDSGGTPKTTVTADADVFRLTPTREIGERLLKLGFIAKWRADNGRPYAQDQDNFEEAKSVLVGADRGSKILVMGRRRYRGGADIALPVGVPFP